MNTSNRKVKRIKRLRIQGYCDSSDAQLSELAFGK